MSHDPTRSPRQRSRASPLIMVHDGQTLLRRSRRWWLWVVYWVGLFVIMHVPLPGPPPVPAGSDKGLHFALYLILALLGGRHQLGKDARTRTGVFILWAVIFTAYAAVDEWLQPFVGRTADLVDWFVDAAGVAVGTAVLILARRWSAPLDRSWSPKRRC